MTERKKVFYAKEYSKKELDEILNNIFGEGKQPKIKVAPNKKNNN